MSIEKRVKRLEAQSGYPATKPTGWATVSSFSNGWAAQGVNTVRWRVNKANQLEIQGLLDSSSATGSVAFTVGSAPTQRTYFVVLGWDSSAGGPVPVRVDIQTSGDVEISGYPPDAGDFVGLGGIVCSLA